jgi:cyanuric acid amidohydrolase
MRQAYVHRLSAAAPDDVTALIEAIERGAITAAGIRAILGKTEGNGCVNDFTRGFAAQSLRLALARASGDPAVAERICMVMSGGTEGALAPHWLVLEARPAAEDSVPDPGGALAIGVARTPELPPEAIGRRAQALAVADAVRAAIAEAAITAPAAVHYVQVKCPLLTAGRVEAAAARGASVATTDTLKSMALSRGASALGVALALGEIPKEQVSDAAIGARLDLFSGCASCSAGVELMYNEVMALGTSQEWTGPLRIDHAVMADPIDVAPVRELLTRLGVREPGAAQRLQIRALLAKVEAPHSGRIRGFRHTMLDDSDISATRHARAAVGGALASVVGHGEIFVSGGAEHQGADGGGPVAVIVDAA